MSQKIYVGNLSFTTTETEVREMFEAHGTVESVNLIEDRETGRPRGFGFVEMADDDAARKAIAALDGSTVDERSLKVNEARPRAESSRSDRRR